LGHSSRSSGTWIRLAESRLVQRRRTVWWVWSPRHEYAQTHIYPLRTRQFGDFWRWTYSSSRCSSSWLAIAYQL
jgi:hypothetical protein